MHASIARTFRRFTFVVAAVLLASIALVGDSSPAQAAPTSGFLLATPVSGSGTVSRTPSAAVFAAGVPVTLTSTANTGWRFDHWELDGSGSGNPLAVVMVRNQNVRAVFVPESTAVVVDSYSLTIEVAGDCCCPGAGDLRGERGRRAASGCPVPPSPSASPASLAVC